MLGSRSWPLTLLALSVAPFLAIANVVFGRRLKARSLEFLSEHFGKSGAHFYDLVRGIDHSAVIPHREPKSLGAEHTFEENISSEIFMLEKLEVIAKELERRLKRNKIAGKTVTLKIKYSDFHQQTRSKTLGYYISSESLLLEVVKELLYQEKLKNSVRLLGISLSNLNTERAEKKINEEEEIAVQLKFEF